MSVNLARAIVDTQALGLVDLALRAVEAYERPDLGQRLERVRERVCDPRMRVLVVGEFKQGKSTLVNALVNAEVCPVDDDVATSVPTAVHYTAAPTAVALHASNDPDGEPHREQVPHDDIAAYVSEAGNPGNDRNLLGVEIGLPRQLLEPGLVLVDTPGVGGLGSGHSVTTIGALPSADAVLLCTDASQELTEPELAFLNMARDLCPTVAVAVTKIDFYPEWRRIADLNRQHLAEHGVDAPVITTSASLRADAAEHDDRELNIESGYPRLLAWLRDRVIADARRVSRRGVAAVVTGVAEQLEAPFAVERSALAGRDRPGDLVADLEAARRDAEMLRSRAAHWQQTLSDGFADLAADADHDVRERMRDVAKKVEAAIEECDPGQVWDQMEQWLYRMTTRQVASHYALVNSRAEDLARDISEHFVYEETVVAARLGVDAPLSRLQSIASAKEVDDGRMGIAAKGLIAMRGSYGGVMMIGIVGSVMGFSLLNPLSLGFGVLLGRKAIRDERERALARRRAEARQACRSYIDEVSFAVNKDARDGLRRLQRALRDTFTEQAAHVQRSTDEAVAAARRALKSSDAERGARMGDVEAEIGRIRGLGEQARQLAEA